MLLSALQALTSCCQASTEGASARTSKAMDLTTGPRLGKPTSPQGMWTVARAESTRQPCPQRPVLPLLPRLLLAIYLAHALAELQAQLPAMSPCNGARLGSEHWQLRTSSLKVLENSDTRSLYLAWLSVPASKQWVSMLSNSCHGHKGADQLRAFLC